jgi:hypothetical protein
MFIHKDSCFSENKKPEKEYKSISEVGTSGSSQDFPVR